MNYYDHTDWPTPDAHYCNWHPNPKGSYALLTGCEGEYDREILATVFETTSGWGGVCNIWDERGRFLRGKSYSTADEVAEVLCGAIDDGNSSSRWASTAGRGWTPIKPKRKSDHGKDMGYWRKSKRGMLTVKPTKTGSWFALIGGKMVTQAGGEKPVWFQTAEEAMMRADGGGATCSK